MATRCLRDRENDRAAEDAGTSAERGGAARTVGGTTKQHPRGVARTPGNGIL